MRTPLHFDGLVVSLIGSSTTLRGPVDASGNFRISGIGIPIVIECQSYANYSLLGSGDHSVNFLMQVL